MKRWMKILCVLTVLVCVVWGAVSYFHYNTVRTLLNRAELADYTNSRELWYSRNLMGLGYTDNYEILLMRLSDPPKRSDGAAGAGGFALDAGGVSLRAGGEIADESRRFGARQAV